MQPVGCENARVQFIGHVILNTYIYIYMIQIFNIYIYIYIYVYVDVHVLLSRPCHLSQPPVPGSIGPMRLPMCRPYGSHGSATAWAWPLSGAYAINRQSICGLTHSPEGGHHRGIGRQYDYPIES